MIPEQLILVVDDDECYRESLKEVLEAGGYAPRIAHSAPAALELASRQTPDLVLLDVAMPGIDGIQLLRYFRSRHVFRQMPVIPSRRGWVGKPCKRRGNSVSST